MEMSYYTLKSTREIASCCITILIMPIELLNSFNLQHYRRITFRLANSGLNLSRHVTNTPVITKIHVKTPV